jgi:hypothetical protein
MDRYTAWRAKTGWAWVKEVELLTQVLEFCRDREWTAKNPARSLKRPRMIEANDIVPYTKQEIIAIIAGCDEIGHSSYERRRVRAMTLVACRGEIVTVPDGAWPTFFVPRFARNFSDNSHRISLYVLHSPKSTSRKGLRLPPMAEISENASKRLPGA